METISIRLDDGMMKELDRIMRKHHFATLTEFVRDAIRTRLKELEKEELLKAVGKLYGSSKKKTTDEELHKAGEEVFRELEEEFGLR